MVSKASASRHISSRCLSALVTQDTAPVPVSNSCPLSKHVKDMIVSIFRRIIHKCQAVYDAQERLPAICKGPWVLCVYACIYVHVHVYSGTLVCITVRACICKWSWRSKGNLRCLSVFWCSSLFFEMTDLLDSHNLLRSLERLANKPQRPACLLSNTGITSVDSHTRLFLMCALRIELTSLCSTKQALTDELLPKPHR